MVVYHFINPDLGVGIFFEKEGAVEKWVIEFEIKDLGIS